MSYTFPITPHAMFEDRFEQFVALGLPRTEVEEMRSAITDMCGAMRQAVGSSNGLGSPGVTWRLSSPIWLPSPTAGRNFPVSRMTQDDGRSPIK
jgi:hypothetical protein